MGDRGPVRRRRGVHAGRDWRALRCAGDFHSAMAGKKTDCMRANPRVCVTCVESGAEIDQLGLTTRYASAILLGTAAEVTETEEKVNTLRLLCRKLAPENPYWQGDFHDCIGHTAVWRVTVDAITGKANRGKQNA